MIIKTITMATTTTTTMIIVYVPFFKHFISPGLKFSQLFSYIKNSFKIATLLIRPEFCAPLVTKLTGFHCIRQEKVFEIRKRDNGLL